MLTAFRERLFKAKTCNDSGEEKNDENENDIGREPIEKQEESIFTHRLEIDEEIKQKVIDANVADNERYDIYDPRNPLNKRKREESKDIMRDRKSNPNSSFSLKSESSRKHK
jgi:peptidyl-prolyl cis-trans isomerase SDCCAG10